LKATQNAFSMKVGGGLGYTFNKHFGVMLLEVDYVLTRFPSFLKLGKRKSEQHRRVGWHPLHGGRRVEG
jgi:hypothetical protein